MARLSHDKSESLSPIDSGSAIKVSKEHGYHRRIPRKTIFTLLSIVLVALYVGQLGISYRDLIVIFGAATLGTILFNGERGIQLGFVLWVLTLALGYRTLRLTANLPIHPSEILLWILLLAICAHSRLRASSKLSLPLWMWLMLPFWVLAWWPLIPGTAHWDQMLNEFRNFFLLVPLMLVTTVLVRKRRDWQRLLAALLTTGTWIAVLGILEFWVPSISRVFSGFMPSAGAGVIEGFERAAFSFWGGPMATFICALTLPLTIVAARWWQAHWQRALIIGSAICQLVAIYIGGYRSIWLIVAVEIVLACFLSLKRQRVTFAAISLVVIIGGYQFVPSAANHRALSGIEALRGRATDSSAKDRISRAEGAFDQMLEAPLGNGWSAAGWVHSDFIQVGANLGLLGGLIFLGGYLYTLARLFRRVVMQPPPEGHDELGSSLLLAYVSAGGILATQGVEVLPQLVLPVWFIWVLVEVWLSKPVGAVELVGTLTVEKQPEVGVTEHWWSPPLAGTEGARH